VKKSISKICGLQINGRAVQSQLDDKLFDSYIIKFSQKMAHKISIPQQRYRKNLKKLKVLRKYVNISFSNQVTTRRFVSIDEHYLTFPYGYLNNGKRD
jgi:hypothetical protein